MKSSTFGQEAPADLKKLIAPMFHIRFVEDYLPSSQSERDGNSSNSVCCRDTRTYIYIYTHMYNYLHL